MDTVSTAEERRNLIAADRPRILVVDDEPGFRELCGILLADSGYVVHSAEDGVTALEHLSGGFHHLVLTDINMPRMDGLSLLKAIKSRWPEVEVILMTAFGGLQTAVEALRHGAYDYITKPFTREVLLATVGRCLEKQRLFLELKRVQGQLIEKERLAALGSVSGWLAHRMRNPLNVIMMCAQYLKQRFDPTDDRRDVTAAIEDKVNVLEGMTRDFIQFSRSYDPEIKTGRFNDVLRSAVDHALPRALLTKIQLVCEAPTAPLDFAFDRELMGEALGYLIDNALQATEPEGRVTLRAAVEGTHVNVDVVNTGAPISPETRSKLFEPFFTTKERGTGLGLAIARRVVERHGGSLRLLDTSETTFRIVLPFQKTLP